MGKITRAQTKNHDEALKIVHLDRDLTPEEIEFVYRNYNPMASHNIGKGAIFFTPYDLAWEFTVMSQPKGVVVDLCAGIGVLTHQILKHDYAGEFGNSKLRGDIKRMICIENNQEFVDAGKRLVPEAEWYCSSVFNLKLLKEFGKVDCVISNPPYGNIPNDGSWLKTQGPIQWKVMEVALRIAYSGGMFIIPSIDSDYDAEKAIYREKKSSNYLRKVFGNIHVTDVGSYTKCYQGDWIGASPDVVIADLNCDDVEWDRPYGFQDI